MDAPSADERTLLDTMVRENRVTRVEARLIERQLAEDSLIAKANHYAQENRFKTLTLRRRDRNLERMRQILLEKQFECPFCGQDPAAHRYTCLLVRE